MIIKKKILLVVLLALSFNLSYADKGIADNELKKRDPYVGRRFHEKTKMVWGEVFKTASILTEKLSAPAYKNYPDAKKIKLPLPVFKGKQLETVISEVLASGDFTPEAITLDELSQILFSADGIIRKQEEIDIRTAPVPLPRTRSFSYMHPIEIYLIVQRVSGLKEGIYHYSFVDHTLELINKKTKILSDCCFEPSVLDNAAITIILTGIPNRLTWRYDTRSYRYIYMVAGAVSQNIYLECASLGLGSIATASFHDDAYNNLLGIDGTKEITLLLHLVGRIKK